jgi:PhzF family phenazine biosynthesis protein
MEIPLYQVDAFSARQFGGNPAAVCPLEFWLPAQLMQAIAAENNLAETAFLVREGERWGLRWFTPEREVDLCGHATLASAYVLFQYLGAPGNTVVFDSRSGELTVSRQGDRLCLNFPSLPAQRVDPHPRLIEGLGTQPLEILAVKDFYLVVYASEDDVRTLQPNFDVLRLMDHFGIIATARGREVDFVSRFFAPAAGIPEDPVTGSAHCTLTPYWAQRLGKKSMRARQISARGGELWVEEAADRILIAGQVAPYLRGTITVEGV